MFATKNTNGFCMTFANGWAVSVQWYRGCYAGDRTGNMETETAEVAVFKPNGDFEGGVHGWVSADALVALMAEAARKKA
jgi:hypothetical protein